MGTERWSNSENDVIPYQISLLFLEEKSHLDQKTNPCKIIFQ